jgi:hypothetical protein
MNLANLLDQSIQLQWKTRMNDFYLTFHDCEITEFSSITNSKPQVFLRPLIFNIIKGLLFILLKGPNNACSFIRVRSYV